MTAKSELRSQLRERRNVFRMGHDSPFPLLPALRQKIETAQCVGSYCSIRSEPDLMAVNHMVLAHKITLAMPRVAGRDSVMTFHRWAETEALETADFGFSQPLPSAPQVEPDLLLVPLLGFDRAMNRIGQGAGHYDRYFERFPSATRIGIAWSVQEQPALNCDPWDVPMHAICTEKEWIIAENPAMDGL